MSHRVCLDLNFGTVFKYKLKIVAQSNVVVGTKGVPDHATKAYRGSRGIVPLILNLGTRRR
jgi:hypothetical protein